jgi:hypothetical protein
VTTRLEGAVSTRFLAWRVALLPFVVSRIISDALILVASHERPVALDPANLDGFAKWDGSWYARIAYEGYRGAYVPGVESPWPFFPLLPWLMRVGHWLGPKPELAGVVLNHGVFFVGLVGLYRITSRRFGGRAGLLAVWTLALFPASFVFSMVYPSAIYFAASVWAFALVEEDRDVAAGLVLVAAVMARPNGFFVAIAIAFAVRWSWRRVLVVCGPAAAAFAAWSWYNAHRTGDFLTFYKAKDAWPEIDLVDFVLRDRKIAIPHVLLAVAAIAAVALVWRKLPGSWLVLTGLALGLPLFVGMVGLGRYVAETFPPFAAAGELLQRWPRVALVAFFGACVVLQAVCVYWVVYLDYIP